VGRIDEIKNLKKTVNNARKTFVSKKYEKIKSFALAESVWYNHINGLY
jgi:hypothetical protein